ncbi:low temperature requirement protein A [Microbacter sp. GSS18]|nr:low temperature requirement protein A [Microbacter sp. GSS18]
MTRSASATGGAPVAHAHEGDRVTTLELFFDLVFVFAFTQVTALMTHGEAPQSLLQAFIVLSLLWWAWTSYTWLANEARANRGILQTAFILAMIAMFLASLAIPGAFHPAEEGLDAAWTLVICYTLVRLIHISTYFIAARGDRALRRQGAVTAATSVLPTAALLAVGAALGGSAQLWIWLVAVVYDFAVIFVTAIDGGGWAIRSAAHFAERHSLVIILALGESIIAIGAGLREAPLDAPFAVGAVLSMLIAVGYWFAYFHRLQGRLEHELERLERKERAKMGREVFTYLHFPIIIGIVLTALGIELAMGHLDEPHLGVLGGWALGCGAAVFLAATAATALRSHGDWRTARLVAAGVFVLISPVLVVVAPLFALGMVSVGLMILAIVEVALMRRGRT